jgi:hypothetical protein
VFTVDTATVPLEMNDVTYSTYQVPGSVTWAGAMEMCAGQGQVLVMPMTDYELAFVNVAVLQPQGIV